MKENTTLLVAKNKTMYFFSTLKELDIASGKDLLDPHYLNSISKQLARYETIIFLDYCFALDMARTVRPFTKAKIILFFWNHFTEAHHQLYQSARLEPAIDDIFHFDPLEARRLGIKHNSSFYSKELQLPLHQPKHDIFFGATNHGRKEKALQLKKNFEQLGLNTFYFILPLKGNDQPGYLSYKDYLQFVTDSKAILELLRAGQTGVTLRTFESIYLQRKLITANHTLRHYRLYNPNNIFLLNERPFEELWAFIHTPFEPVSDELIDFFDVKQWIARFHTPIDDHTFDLEYVPTIFSNLVSEA